MLTPGNAPPKPRPKQNPLMLALKDAGFGKPLPFMSDPYFVAALSAGGIFCLAAHFTGALDMLARPEGMLTIAAIILWRPLVEEVLFRGIIQGILFRRPGWDTPFRFTGFVTGANLATTVLFTAAHLMDGVTFWRLSVALPSLVFGYFREKSESVYPSIILHSSYNLFLFLSLPAAAQG